MLGAGRFNVLVGRRFCDRHDGMLKWLLLLSGLMMGLLMLLLLRLMGMMMEFVVLVVCVAVMVNSIVASLWLCLATAGVGVD